MSALRDTFIICSAAFLLTACSGGSSNTVYNDIDARDSGGGTRGNFNNSKLSDISTFSTNGGQTGGGLTPVNRYLWQASLDTLSFLPLSSTDPFTGVIATDWAASPEAPEERFKVTAYVNSPALAADALQVAVFREVRDQAGGWATAPVSGETARKLEDAILVRARQLRIGDRESG